MTNAETPARPGRRDERMSYAMKRWEANNPGSFFAGVTYDDATGDVFIDHVPGGNTQRYSIEGLRRYGMIVTYRVDAEDIDQGLAPRVGTVVERLRSHGLTADAAGPNRVRLDLTDSAARALADALDRLEALS